MAAYAATFVDLNNSEIAPCRKTGAAMEGAAAQVATMIERELKIGPVRHVRSIVTARELSLADLPSSGKSTSRMAIDARRDTAEVLVDDDGTEYWLCIEFDHKRRRAVVNLLLKAAF